MVLKNILCGLLFAAVIFAPAAYAGKRTLSTHYASPTGEYTEINTSGKLSVPMKTVTDKNQVVQGEIWVDPCFDKPGQHWDAATSACVS